MKMFVALLVVLAATASAQPFAPGTGFLPTGNLRTTDKGGPYNLTLLPVQINEIKAGIAARANYTDRDFVDFLVNVECLEGQFDTWGTFGHGFLGNLSQGGPVPIGAKKANLSAEVEQYLQEVALNEQGHVLFTRHAGSSLPCPPINFTAFNQYYSAVYGLDPSPGANSIKKKFGHVFDPFLNDETYTTSVLALEELGCTGNKGLAGAIANPVISTSVAGLATSACQHSTLERIILWERRNNVVFPFNETVQQVFSRISAFRDSLDGPQFDDQGLVNTDPRTIALPDGFFNSMPTDIHGITFNRTPKMLLNILFLGIHDNGKGSFFPEGVVGAINTPVGYNLTDSGLTSFPYTALVDGQQSVAQVGTILPPLSPTYQPMYVEGSMQLSQDLAGPIANASYLSRGYVTIPTRNPLGNNKNISVTLPIETGTVTGYAEQVCYRTSQ